jgi:hypothetical protein
MAQMENVLEKLVDLLGKTPYHSDWQQFIRDVGEEPEFVADAGTYEFKKAGFKLTLFEGTFFTAVFEFVENGPNFSGEFPGGVAIGDELKDVQKKLGIYSRRSRLSGDKRSTLERLHNEQYDLQRYILLLAYDSDLKVSKMSVRAKFKKGVEN